MADIQVEIGHDDVPCVIAVSGDVDIAAAPALIDAGLTAISQMDDACPTVVIDLDRVTFMDSTGLGALIEIRNAANESGKRATLRGIPKRVAKILTITGLEKAFDIDGDSLVELEAGRWLG